MAKKNNKLKKKSNKKTKKPTNITKTIDTVIPISTPVGSVHFDEFLKICKEPKLIQNTVEPAKKANDSKKDKSKKSKKAKKPKKPKKSKKSKKNEKIGISKIKVVVKPDDVPPSPQPTLFPLIKTLLLPSNDDALDENALFSVYYTKHIIKVHKIKMLHYRNLLLVNLIH